MKDLLKLKYLLMSVLFASFVFVSCGDKEEDDITPNEKENTTEVLVKYLEQTDFINNYAPAMITAEALKAEMLTGDVKIIDVRTKEDYDKGHIDGAVQVNVPDVLDYVEAKGFAKTDKIVFVCYSGQGAGYLTSLFRLIGYENAFDLKWGISGWHTNFAGTWINSTTNKYDTQFTTDVTNKAEAGELPELTSTSTDGAEIAYERVKAVIKELAEGKISADATFANLNNYYILNYWPEEHYNMGHIPGAIQYTPKQTLKLDAALKTLPTDKTIVVYCYTGHTSSHVVAYLRVLGYDAKSLLFGINSMRYDWALENNLSPWKASYIMDYDFVE